MENMHLFISVVLLSLTLGFGSGEINKLNETEIKRNLGRQRVGLGGYGYGAVPSVPMPTYAAESFASTPYFTEAAPVAPYGYEGPLASKASRFKMHKLPRADLQPLRTSTFAQPTVEVIPERVTESIVPAPIVIPIQFSSPSVSAPAVEPIVIETFVEPPTPRESSIGKELLLDRISQKLDQKIQEWGNSRIQTPIINTIPASEVVQAPVPYSAYPTGYRHPNGEDVNTYVFATGAKANNGYRAPMYPKY